MHAPTLIPLLFALPSLAAPVPEPQTQKVFPNLIIPVSKLDPDTHFPTQNTFDVERDIHTQISFQIPDIPAFRCSLNFSLPNNTTLLANPDMFFLWGYAPYLFNITALNSAIDKDNDTWNSRPWPTDTAAQVEIFANGTFEQHGVLPFPCAMGSAEFVVHPAYADADWGVRWFELAEPTLGITYDILG